MEITDNDSRNFVLTNEAILKSDRDISTISTLTEYANKTGNMLVVHGGYATEALCGGTITRAHGDVDAHIIVTSQTPFDQLMSAIEELLQKEETKWIVRSKKPHKLDYLEDDDTKEFFDKRRVEVTLHNPNPDKPKFSKKKLRDSKDNEIEIYVPDLYELTASKIHKLYLVRNGIDEAVDRHPSKTDLIDLKRLLNVNEFDNEALFAALVKTIEFSDPNHAKQQAQEAFDYSTSLL